MIIKIKELCEVEYIDERDTDAKGANLAIRKIEYDSDKKTLLEAFKQFENNFDIDKVIDCEDEFDGECLDTIKTLSVEELSCIQKKLWISYIIPLRNCQRGYLKKYIYLVISKPMR